MAHQRTQTTPRVLGGLFVFVAWYVIYCLAIFYKRPHSPAFYFNDALKDIFLAEEFPEEFTHIYKSFNDVFTWEEAFQFMQGPLLAGLYITEDYAGHLLPDGRKNAFIYGTNRFVGATRITQLRVRNGTCTIPDLFEDSIDLCYGDFSSSHQETDPIKEDYELPEYIPNDPWVFHDSSELQGGSYPGRHTTYSGGGYYMDFPINGENASLALQYLMDEDWFDNSTRAVFVDFSIYNAAINLFSVVRLAFEQPPGGGVFPWHTFRVLKIFNDLTVTDLIVQGLEIIVVLFALAFFIYDLVFVFKKGIKYQFLRQSWNILDLCIYMVLIVLVFLRIYAESSIADLTDETFKPEDRSNYINFQAVGFLLNQELNVQSVLAFLITFRWFRFFSLSHRLSQLLRVLEKAASDLLAFVIVFAVILWGFAMFGNVAFGVDLSEFRSMTITSMTLFRAMLGDIDFDGMQATNRYLGPLFYIMFTFFVYLILLNMFLAIINDTYTVVREEIASGADPLVESLLGFVRQSGLYRKLFGYDVRDVQWIPNKLLDFAAIDANRDNRISVSELRQVKRKAADAWRFQYGDQGAEEIMGLFDQNGDGYLDMSEYQQLQAVLNEAQRKVEEQRVWNEFKRLQTQMFARGQHPLMHIPDMQVQMQELSQQVSALNSQLSELSSAVARTQRQLRYSRA